MKSATEILDHFKGVKRLKEGEWIALCPAHNDRDPSLTLTELPDKMLIKCQAGCASEAVVKAAGLTFSDLFFSDNGRKPASGRVYGEIEITYPYQDADGKLLFEVVRYRDPKGFSQRRPDPSKPDGYVWGLQGVRPVLYHLPELAAAIEHGDPVYFTEGEKDADNLARAFNVTATCNPMGAGKWREYYLDHLIGAKEVRIIPDNDPPGQKHASQIANALYEAGVAVKVLTPPDELKDVTDWLSAGLDLNGLLIAFDETPPWEPKFDTSKDGIPIRYNKTDMGNAERLRDTFGSQLRYCYRRKQWLVWTGKYWKWNDGGAAKKLAKLTVRAILDEAAKENDDDERKALVKWALASESHTRLEAMLAETQDLLEIELDELDRNKWLLNCENGTIDLKTGVLHSHNSDDLLTHKLKVDYDPAAKGPLWDKFLERIMQGNADLIAYLQRCMGYSLTADTSEQAVFFTYGSGMNGKSTFLNAFRKMLGNLSMQADIETFMSAYKPQKQAHTEDVANLHGKRYVLTTEVDEGRRMAVNKVKGMTGGEAIRASHKHEKEFEFEPTFKLWMLGNHKPDITDTTHSIWRRVKLIPFTVTIPPGERDKQLEDKLREEWPAVLAWAVQGCLDWQQFGLVDPLEVTNAVQEYRREQDILGEFIFARCKVDLHNAECVISKAALYEGYTDWCKANAVDPVTQRTFNKRIAEKGIASFISSGNAKWRYIRLMTEYEMPTTDEEWELKKIEDSAQIPGIGKVDEVDKVDDFPVNSYTRENIEKDTGNPSTSSTSSTPSTTPESDVLASNSRGQSTPQSIQPYAAKKKEPEEPLYDYREDLVALVGIGVEEVCFLWNTMGRPRIELSQGIGTDDLEKFLERPLYNHEHLTAIVDWVMKVREEGEEG